MSTNLRILSGKFSFYDGHETVLPLSPVVFEDDFLGKALRKYITNENTTATWGTTETDLNLAPALVDDAVNGIVQLTLDSDDSAQQAALHFGDNLCFSMKQGLIFETRLCFRVLPTSGVAEHARAIFGLASADNATPDSVATNAWFRVESTSQTQLLWETDDGNTDDDDNDASTLLVADIYHIYRIDCRDLVNGVKFYVDDVLVGTSGDFLTNLTDAEAKVQPYFCVSKAKSAANLGVGTMYIDYVRVWQNRS